MKLLDVLIGLLVSMFVLAGAALLFSTLSRQFSKQQLRSDEMHDSHVVLAQLVSDIRWSGANPAGVMGIPAGQPIPLGLATTNKIELRSDINADGDVADAMEDVVYSFEDHKIVRININDENKKAVLLTDVTDFKLQYVDSDGNVSDQVEDPSKLRRVRIRMSTLTTEVVLRNFS